MADKNGNTPIFNHLDGAQAPATENFAMVSLGIEMSLGEEIGHVGCEIQATSFR